MIDLGRTGTVKATYDLTPAATSNLAYPHGALDDPLGRLVAGNAYVQKFRQSPATPESPVLRLEAKRTR